MRAASPLLSSSGSPCVETHGRRVSFVETTQNSTMTSIDTVDKASQGNASTPLTTTAALLPSMSATHLLNYSENMKNDTAHSSSNTSRSSEGGAEHSVVTKETESAIAAAMNASHVSLHVATTSPVKRASITSNTNNSNSTGVQWPRRERHASLIPTTPPLALHFVDHTCRDRLSTLYFCIFTRTLNRTILAISLLLVCLSMYKPRCLVQSWYHVLEGLLTSLFVSEVGLRFILMRGKFFAAMFNVVEALACIMCVALFLLLHYNRRLSNLTVGEHRSLLLLRYVSQALRVMGIVALDAVSAEASRSHHDNNITINGSSGDGIHIYAVGTDVVQPCAPLVAARRRVNGHYEIV